MTTTTDSVSSTDGNARGADGGWMTEADAVRIALEGTARERVTTAARALFELLRDSSRTEQVFLLGLVVNGPFFPSLVAKVAASPGGPELLAESPTIDSKNVDFGRAPRSSRDDARRRLCALPRREQARSRLVPTASRSSRGRANDREAHPPDARHLARAHGLPAQRAWRARAPRLHLRPIANAEPAPHRDLRHARESPRGDGVGDRRVSARQRSRVPRARTLRGDVGTRPRRRASRAPRSPGETRPLALLTHGRRFRPVYCGGSSTNQSPSRSRMSVISAPDSSRMR